MTTQSDKSNNLQNVKSIRGATGNVTIQKDPTSNTESKKPAKIMTLPLRSSSASFMILSRKRVGESTSSSNRNSSSGPVSSASIKLTALLALLYRYSMTCMMLVFMLYFLIEAHRAWCQTLFF